MSLITGSDFNYLFEAFKRTAFRLEGRDQYYAPDERDRIRKFLAGEGYDVASRLASPWWQLIRAATTGGKRVERVRVVTEPHGDYTRYALAGAPINIEGGEDIRYLSRDTAASVGLPEHDFWLFDDEVAAVMHFGDDDTFQGAELLRGAAEVEQYRQWQDTAWLHAIPYADYIR